MPIHKGLLCTAEQLQQIRELTERVNEDLPSGEKFVQLFEERQRAKDQLKTLLASLRPPTIEELAAEVEQLQNKIESLQTKLEAKLTEGRRSKCERRAS
jgi:ATP phosphoribosyltransferase